MAIFDRAQFLRPIAHRGWHDAAAGRIENSGPAFEAAIEKGFGIECDVRPAKGGLPVVFHDETLERVTRHSGAIADQTAESLKNLRYPACGTHILTLEELLELVGGRVPLFVEIKSEWGAPDVNFLREVARLSQSYKGPLALMSFDPAVMTHIRAFAPDVPRGIVSGSYESEEVDGWWQDQLSAERRFNLANLLENGPVHPQFIAYHVKALPTPVTRFTREVLGLPLLTWTVRSPDDWSRAKAWADAPIFEGLVS